jgi:hypothetical protein
MDIVYVILGLSTMWLFMFKIEWLFNRKYFLVNIAYNVVLFCISLLIINSQLGNPKMVVALKMPLVSSIIFFVLYCLFRVIYKRNPENTFWTFTKKPIQDIMFTLMFWFLGVGLPIFIVG